MDKKVLTIETTFSEVMKGMKEHKVGEIMSCPIIKAHDDITIQEAIERMRSADINALPIVRKGTKELIGIVTNTDLVKLLARILDSKERHATRGCSDVVIRVL
jgi:CBS domain-containing protein